MKKSNLLRYGLLAGACAVMAACSTTAEDLDDPNGKEQGKEEQGKNDPISEEQAVDLGLTWDEQQIARTQSKMAFGMLETTLKENGGEDALLSPLSAEMALDLLANGMQGESLTELLKTLDAKDLETLNSMNKKVVERLPKSNPTGVKVKMDFGNWQNSIYTFNSDYSEKLKDMYEVPTYSYDFTKTDMRSIINKWALEKTDGLIKDLLKNPVETRTPIVLCNSLYFDSKWENPFEKDKTVKADFKDAQGNTVGQAMMMTFPKTNTYVQHKTYKSTSLDYQGYKFSFNIYLPEPGCSFEDVIQEINKLGESTAYYAKSLKIPRFEMDFNGDITPSLKACGIDIAKGDYSLISKNIKDVNMLQGSYIKVNEEGTLAAAVTATLMIESSGQMFKVGEDFIVDRPFIYTVTERSGLVLFVGTMSNPGVK